MSFGPITQHDWLNRNSLRAFPVVENSVLKFSSGEDMPNSILVDLFLAVALPGPMTLCVATVSFTLKTVTVVLSGKETGASVGYATAVLGVNDPNSPIPIQSPDDLASGTITLGKILDTSQRTDFGAFIGNHKQAVPVVIDQRCYICTGLPMVESMEVGLQDGMVNGNMVFTLGSELKAEITELLFDGLKETEVLISLAHPEEFLPDCYPKYIDPLCFCGQVPVVTVNGVPRDEEGDLGIDIEIVGEKASITNNGGESLVEVLVERKRTEICIEDPVVPDGYGRLGPVYSKDCPPTDDDLNYGLGLGVAGPACQNPPPRPPPPEENPPP
jgi:hypothetical protein